MLLQLAVADVGDVLLLDRLGSSFGRSIDCFDGEVTCELSLASGSIRSFSSCCCSCC